MRNKHSLHATAFLVLVGALAAAGAGCSRQANAPVDADRARQALRAALESWKKGDPVNALESAAPPIYVIDVDWRAGTRLKDYRVVGDGQEMDAHLFCPVKLTLQGPGGQETRRDVTYIISTAPNVTVSRKLF